MYVNTVWLYNPLHKFYIVHSYRAGPLAEWIMSGSRGLGCQYLGLDGGTVKTPALPKQTVTTTRECHLSTVVFKLTHTMVHINKRHMVPCIMFDPAYSG